MKKKLIFIAIAFCCIHSVQAQMVLEFSIASNPTIISLPLNGAVNVNINWGDGASETVTTAGPASHTYTSVGTETVTITGSLTQFGIPNHTSGLSSLQSVQSWDNLGLISLSWAFTGAVQLTSVPASLPIGVTDLSYLFYNASSFNQPIGSWNTANVNNMAGMFSQAYTFNQPLGTWNTANVRDMSFMFENDTSFNQPIGSWNTANVNNMAGMFSQAHTFNQPIGSWNTSNVTDLSFMFSQAYSYNQPLGAWNTTNVSRMAGMFDLSYVFNQPLETWNTGNVTDMSNMFAGASLFNQPLGSWNTGNVTTMTGMFFSATSFNQSLASWNTGNVTNMSVMFALASLFNQPLGSWNTENVTTMTGMFQGAGFFNQPIGSWNTANVTDMSYMFKNDTSFNQPIGTWNISKVTNMSSMFTGDTLCTINYDHLLNGWAGQTVASGLSFDGGYSQYSSVGSAARATLVNNEDWAITDGGLNPDNTQCYKSLVTGLESMTVSRAVGINPNPSTGQITISGNEALGNIMIYKSNGTIVYQTNTTGLEQIIDISNNDPGLYLVKVGNQTIKLVKE